MLAWKKMFCFQCEQTAGGTGCTGCAGVCGKNAQTSRLQDELTGALITLAHHAKAPQAENLARDQLLIEGLFTTLTNVNFDDSAIGRLLDTVHAETVKLQAAAVDYDMKNIWEADEDICSLKSLLLFGIRGVAAYAYHASVLGYSDETVNHFFYQDLSAL